MKSHFKSGFTIVELVIVISIIVILSGISIMTYQTIRRDARDAKRKADIEILVGRFEKYYETRGEYPTGCSNRTAANSTHCIEYSGTAPPLFSSPTSNPDAFYKATTISQLKTLFPELPDTLGDPTQQDGMPFNTARYDVYGNGGLGNGTGKFAYFYVGQMRGVPGQGVTSRAIIGPNNNTEIACDTSSHFWFRRIGESSSITYPYVLAYFSESKNKWYVYQGKHSNEELTMSTSSTVSVRGQTIGNCVFVQ